MIAGNEKIVAQRGIRCVAKMMLPKEMVVAQALKVGYSRQTEVVVECKEVVFGGETRCAR